YGQYNGSQTNFLHMGFRSSNVFMMGFGGDDCNTTVKYSDNNWHHWAATYESNTKSQKIYRDGVEVASRTANASYTWTGVVSIGKYVTDAHYFNGQLDEFRIWNVARTADEIRSNYTKTLTGNETNLTAYYKFDELAGNTAIDSSQGGNNATLVNMNTQIAWKTNAPEILSNPKEMALGMNGATDYVDVADSVWFDGSDFTIEAWVYMNSHQTWSRIIDFGNGADNNNVVLAATVGDSGKPAIYFWNGAPYYYLHIDTQIPLLQWVHVSVTLDSNNKVTAYFDGVEVASGTATLRPANVHRVNCYIGKSNWQDKLFSGCIDEVRIWNVARTQDQIKNNKERPLIGNEYGLIGYWNMNDFGRYTIRDFASGRDGVYTSRWNQYHTEKVSFPNLKHVHMSAKNNTYIEIPHRKVLNPDSELTLETWVKPIQSGNNIIAGKFNDALNRGYLLKVNSSMEVIAEVWDNAGTAHTLNIGSLSVSNWSHIAVTWMKNGKLTGYIDGVQTAQIDASQELLSMTADPFYISYSTNIAQIKIDEVRAWSVARSYSQIQQNMNTRLTGLESGIIGYWRFDEAQGDVVKDSTTNYSHGYLHSSNIDNSWAIETRSSRSVYRDGVLIAVDEPSQPYSSSGGMTIGATPWSTE
ncbi:hypothetical protein MHK_005638, partial [Candidatus Magnetomorum sp. HK-1]